MLTSAWQGTGTVGAFPMLPQVLPKAPYSPRKTGDTWALALQKCNQTPYNKLGKERKSSANVNINAADV